MSKAAGDLDRLIRESDEAIQRLDAIQKARHNAPLLQRVRNHFARNSAHLANVLLAGTVLAVALGRLAQKQEHEVSRSRSMRHCMRALQAAMQGRVAAQAPACGVLLPVVHACCSLRGKRCSPLPVAALLALNQRPLV